MSSPSLSGFSSTISEREDLGISYDDEEQKRDLKALRGTKAKGAERLKEVVKVERAQLGTSPEWQRQVQ